MKDFILTPPISYLDMIQLLSKSELVLTDSGGIQEETTILGVPCLTLRENTERPITISKGTNVLVGTDPEDILKAVKKVLDCNRNYTSSPKFWDGFASKRIVDVLENWQPH